MKQIHKSDLAYKNGRLWTEDGQAVYINQEIVDGLNNIERKLQEARHVAATAVEEKAEHFKFKSETDKLKIEMPKPETKLLDKKVNEAMKIVAELDAIEKYNQVNETLKGCPDSLIEFLAEDYVFSSSKECGRFDLYTLGNPLEITQQVVIDAVCEIAKAV